MASILKVVRVGVGYRHGSDFLIDRPSGSGDTLFLRFLVPVRILTDDGIKLAGPGSCMVYAPGRPQWYRGADGPLVNDWVHFKGRNGRELMRRHRVPVGVVFYPSQSAFVPTILSEIESEMFRRAARWEEAVALLLEKLLLHLGRHTADAQRRPLLSRGEAQRIEAFRELRSLVHGDLASRWTVDRMATRVHLSAPRFAVLYKRFFEISPIDDLIEARLGKARWLLTNTSMQVSEVARQSGFENIYYFSRVFRRRVGCAPSAYYRTHIGGERVNRSR